MCALAEHATVNYVNFYLQIFFFARAGCGKKNAFGCDLRKRNITASSPNNNLDISDLMTYVLWFSTYWQHWIVVSVVQFIKRGTG